jgi:hypothetical protein
MIAAAPPETNPYGPTIPPSEAPSAITQAVASLPPEQMFELMKQMKVCSSFCLTSILIKLHKLVCILSVPNCSS